MNMNLQIASLIITKGKERRLSDNTFILEMGEYCLFPMNTIIPIYREDGKSFVGSGKVKKLIWVNGWTTIEYELTSLFSVN